MFFFFLIFFLLPVLDAGSFSEVQASDVSLHGFLQGNYSFDVVAPNPDGGDFKVAEERVQLRLEATKEPFRLFVKTDMFLDDTEPRGDGVLREGYIEYTASNWDVRLGRQIITWGVGDLIFINDFFPKDYSAFYSGRPLEYLKIGSDAVKVGIYPGFASFEVVVIPFFTPDTNPSPNTFWLFDPFFTVASRETEEPPVTLGNTQIAFRAYREISGFDASLYLYRGFSGQPSMMPDNMTMPTKLAIFYPELSVLGASLQGRALDGVLSLEAGYYDSRQNRSGTNPFIPNSQMRFLVGYQRQLWEDFTAELQYYGQYMSDYSEYVQNLPLGIPPQRRLRDLLTVRLTQLLLNQALKLSFFSFYSPSDGDYMLNPEIKYNFSDHVWSAIGANLFGGNRFTQFGQLKKDDNVYVQVRYEF